MKEEHPDDTPQSTQSVNLEQSSVPLILTLDDPAATLAVVGGKGASLARLKVAGLPVPSGFYVTTAGYNRFVAEHELQHPILEALTSVRADEPGTLETASQHIQALFAQQKMPDEIASAIRTAYSNLGNDEVPVAVRSSATAEDLPGMSFAGQQETYLNMRGDAMVLDAVKRCWASLWTARAIGYRMRQGIAPDDVSLAVVIQTLVPADAAGILFTANPLTGLHNQILINAAWGLGEAIVSGQITPDLIVIDRDTGKVVEEQVSTKDVMTIRTSAGTEEAPVPIEQRSQAALTPAQASELADLGTRIEDLYDQPMDIEWALHDAQIFIVQARPITALPEPSTQSDKVQPLEWSLPNPNGRYMRSSVFELLPDPLSPLFVTLGLPEWSRSMQTLMQAFKIRGIFPGAVFTTISGYGYYDLSFTRLQSLQLLLAMPRIFAMLPSLLKSSEGRWKEARSRYTAIINQWQAADFATVSGERLLDGAHTITNIAAQYYLSIQSGILPASYMSELFFTVAYNKLLKRRSDPPALTFMLGFDSTPIRAEKSLYDLAQWARTQPALASALAAMSSERFTTLYQNRAEEPDAVWSEWWQRLDTHLAHFGHTIYDLDFAKAVLADEPAAILETLKFFLSGQAPDPYQRQATATAAREQATATINAGLHGLRLRIFRRLVRWAQAFAPLREDALADVGLGWPVLRRMLRELGRRLVECSALTSADDIFWLTLTELRESIAALDAHQELPAQYQAIVAERRATFKRERALTPPAALPIKGGARFLGIDFTRMMPARTEQAAGDVLQGIAASPGHITGQARVIHGPEEFDQMRPGDILVARITTPAWTPLFALAAGIVTDVGGPLSHSSIVAREYHIPAVLGTGEATERLSSGQQIAVDGDAGLVTRLAS